MVSVYCLIINEIFFKKRMKKYMFLIVYMFVYFVLFICVKYWVYVLRF